MRFVFLVALGSAVGGALRYLTSVAFARVLGQGFPWGTFAVNVVGCLCIGVAHQVAVTRGVSSEVRLLATTGLLGGFTTFSTFGLESVDLWSRAPGLAVLNVAGQVLLGLAAVAAGLLLGRYVAG